MMTLGNATKSTGDKVRQSMALAIGRCADQMSSLVRWLQTIEAVASTFGRQALPIVWDYCEIVPTGDYAANFGAALDWIVRVIEAWPKSKLAQVQASSATSSPFPDETVSVWFTDPPYYDSIDYAHCSDFFFVWLKRALPGHPLMRDPFDPSNPLTPKSDEIVVDSTTTRGHGMRTPEFYEKAMGRAFSEGRRVLREDGIGSVVFAHKTTEGWEALLSGLIKGGWTITGSWPLATERPVRLRARESAALATSVHLVCRPRTEDKIGDWGEVLGELPKRVGDWMERLQSEGIRGADLVFACIGPALEIFSRYSKVETAEGREVGLPEYLEKVWEVVGRTALVQVLGTAGLPAGASAQAGAFEEDARLTALFLWTLQSTNGYSPSPAPSPPQGRGEKSEDSPMEGREEELEEEEEEEGPTKKKQGYSLIFDVVRRFAQPLGIHLPEWEDRVIETEKGVVRLLSVKERAKQLFGEESVSVAGFRIEEQARRDPQMKFDFALSGERAAPDLSAEALAQAGIKARRPKKKKELTPGLPAKALAQAGASAKVGTTTLDRVHAAMLLQASGQTNALRALLKAEQDRGPDFLRLANALSALYPKNSEEKSYWTPCY
jgi:hypothetical protein